MIEVRDNFDGPHRLRPALRPVQDTDDLNHFFSDAIDREKGQTGQDQFSSIAFASRSAKMRELFQGSDPCLNTKRCLPSLSWAKPLFGVVANGNKVLRGRPRPLNEH